MDSELLEPSSDGQAEIFFYKLQYIVVDGVIVLFIETSTSSLKNKILTNPRL